MDCGLIGTSSDTLGDGPDDFGVLGALGAWEATEVIGKGLEGIQTLSEMKCDDAGATGAKSGAGEY